MLDLKVDIAIILSLVLLALAAYLVYPYMTENRENNRNSVEISVNGKLVGEYPADDDADIPVKTDYGYNLIEIKDGKVSISEADCLDKLCVNKGKITGNGQQIVCLPHRLVVKLNRSTEEGDYDAFAY